MEDEILRRTYYKPDHRTFGGRIYLFDFETEYRGRDNKHGSSIAQRIITDWNFDIQCKKNIIGRDKKKKSIENNE